MLRIQLLGHSSIKEDVKLFLREAGVVQVTDVSLEERESSFDEDRVREMQRLLEMAEGSLEFLDQYSEKISIFERMGKGPLETSPDEIEGLLKEFSVEEASGRCVELQTAIRSVRDELSRSQELVRFLEPWRKLSVPLERLSTEGYEVQFWAIPESVLERELEEVKGRLPLVQFEECARSGGKSYNAVILPKGEKESVGEALKEIGGFRNAFEKLKGTPNEIIESEKERWSELEERIEEARTEAKKLAGEKDKILILADHYRESMGLGDVERHFHSTDDTFLLEGWVRALDRKRLERELLARYKEIELAFHRPLEDEEPPICLDNGPTVRPFEFVTTLYGRPVYREVDPTPLLAPFFILFFALCLTDAGYGLTLAAVSALIIFKFKPSGGAGLLMRLLLMGGIITAVIGVITGGIFGIEAGSFPPFIQRFIFINPLEEPMKMLNIAFLMGLVHMLFGMGVRMTSNFRAGLVTDALFDDLLWIIFLIALAPLGYSAILGGEIPAEVSFWGKRVSLVAAGGIFVTGGRKQKSIVGKFLKGLIGFYDVVGYFGDVLSYARLLALGLATSAIALAVNGIAGMVKGLPFYTGYVAMALVLILGHLFNLAVNTLGAFVHSGRLQYLEFFSKFFTGGGREFRPFKSERSYSVVNRKESKS